MMDQQYTPERPMGSCPVCGGNIIRGKQDYGCANWRSADGGCRFVIRREISGKTVEPRVVKELVEKRRTAPLPGFVTAAGEPFVGVLILGQGEGQWSVTVTPVDQPAGMAEPGPESGGDLGRCPACGGAVTENAKSYGCENWREADGGCRFVIWKEVARKAITPEMARDLLRKPEGIGPFSDFVSKKGSPFTASLKLVQEGARWAVKFQFDDAPPEAGPGPGEQSAIGACPACGGDVVPTAKGYGCVNWRDEDGGCRFTIWKRMAQREISLETARQLLETGTTDLLPGFVSRKGSSFMARLKVVEGEGGMRVGFDFPDNP